MDGRDLELALSKIVIRKVSDTPLRINALENRHDILNRQWLESVEMLIDYNVHLAVFREDRKALPKVSARQFLKTEDLDLDYLQ